MALAISHPWGHVAAGHLQLCLAGCSWHGPGRGAHHRQPTRGFRRLQASPGWWHQRLGGTAVPASRRPSWHWGCPYKSTPSVHTEWAFCIKTWFLAPKEGLLAAPGGHGASAVRTAASGDGHGAAGGAGTALAFSYIGLGLVGWCLCLFFFFAFGVCSFPLVSSLPAPRQHGEGGQEAGGGGLVGEAIGQHPRGGSARVLPGAGQSVSLKATPRR